MSNTVFIPRAEIEAIRQRCGGPRQKAETAYYLAKEAKRLAQVAAGRHLAWSDVVLGPVQESAAGLTVQFALKEIDWS